MADYSYVRGDGSSVLDKTTPVGQSEPGPVLDDAIRQIKAYLNDDLVGPDALITAMLAEANAVVVPPGGTGVVGSTVIAYAGNTIPTGWALSDGTTYGGHASPDLRGRTPLGLTASGAELGTVTEAKTLRGKTGTAKVLLQNGQIATHQHRLESSSPYVVFSVASSPMMGALQQPFAGSEQLVTGGDFYDFPAISAPGLAKTVTDPTSGNPITTQVAHSNVQPSIAMQYIVKK